MDLQNLGRSAEKILEVNGDKFNILASKFWSTWVGPGARRSKLMFRTWKGDKEFEPQSENTADTTVTTTIPGIPDLNAAGDGSVHYPLSAKESFKAAVTYLFRKWYVRAVSFWRNIKQLTENSLQLMVRSLTRIFETAALFNSLQESPPFVGPRWIVSGAAKKLLYVPF